MLRQCNERLEELMTSLKDVDIQEQLNLMEQEEVGEFCKSHIDSLCPFG